ILCVNSGYFNLYFEPGCGMEGNTTVEIARRDVLCQLFSDLSNFITQRVTKSMSISGSEISIMSPLRKHTKSKKFLLAIFIFFSIS
ncbi:MAG: hypothetical protein V3V00_09370, partial [Saprospiraceae bacterium]